MSQPIRTFIYGSCVSRDTIAAARPGEFEIKGYVARQSLISMARNAFDTWPKGFRLKSKFQQRMVQGDWLGNAWWRFIKAGEDGTDLFLWDITDERLGFYRSSAGTVVTKSIDMMNTPLEEIVSDWEFIPFGSDQHFALWTMALKKHTQRLKDHHIFEKVIVLKVPWASLTEDNHPVANSLDLTAEEANALFERYYNKFVELGYRVIEPLGVEVRAYSSHQWGIAAYHYTPAVYESILMQLRGERPEPDDAPAADDAKPETEAPWALQKNYTRISSLHAQWDSADQFLAADEHVDGVHTVQLGETAVELYLQGQPLQSEQRTIPVFFSGAVTDRGSKQPPFFSGYGLSQSIGTPFLAISDPLIDENSEVNIGWYAGEITKNLQGRLALFLNELHHRFTKQLLLVGGSAGGFAALHYAMRIGEGASAFVWNPQTDITEYRETFVRRYLKAAGFKQEVLQAPDWKKQAKDSSAGKLSLQLADPQSLLHTGKSLIIQNESDWHLKAHLLPWLETANWVQEEHHGVKLYIADDDHIVAIGDFAEGHAPIPTVVVKMVLTSLLKSDTTVRETIL